MVKGIEMERRGSGIEAEAEAGDEGSGAGVEDAGSGAEAEDTGPERKQRNTSSDHLGRPDGTPVHSRVTPAGCKHRGNNCCLRLLPRKCPQDPDAKEVRYRSDK